VPEILSLDDPAAIAAATHPARAALLAAMRQPTSAAAAARATGQTRQNAAYHVKELASVGLLRHAGQRKNGNFTEQLYVTVAPTIVISPRSTWGDDPRRLDALGAQLSLGQLVQHGDQLQRDAAALLDRAAFDGDQIASASASTEIHFASESDRAAFLREYIEMLTELAERHGTTTGDVFRVLFAAYPDPEDT
jgi:hypothetical protein